MIRKKLISILLANPWSPFRGQLGRNSSVETARYPSREYIFIYFRSQTAHKYLIVTFTSRYCDHWVKWILFPCLLLLVHGAFLSSSLWLGQTDPLVLLWSTDFGCENNLCFLTTMQVMQGFAPSASVVLYFLGWANTMTTNNNFLNFAFDVILINVHGKGNNHSKLFVLKAGFLYTFEEERRAGKRGEDTLYFLSKFAEERREGKGFEWMHCIVKAEEDNNSMEERVTYKHKIRFLLRKHTSFLSSLIQKRKTDAYKG